MVVERRGVVKAWMVALAMGLAVLGVGVSLVGANLASPWLEHWVGPALTVAGAILWLALRWRATGDRAGRKD